ncbi:sensor histidine kinase [Hymenobacter sp. ASUV-10]|uniref:Sensor histidine kinase n=1 Tax=Hymenobacter aranciens TaxID=3063996 RepID=A0ABT9BFR2_9BACT|nr:sensor histidine kinase [Hymenobacter sp. ASUV-10]MDO7877114.1 sensor histidine kinase [Hymenobacter sp. ASUV-10]
MKINRFWRNRVLRHLLGWLLLVSIIAAMFLAVLPAAKAEEMLRSIPLHLALLAVPIYLHFWVLGRLLEQRRYGRYALATLGIVLFGTLLDAFFDSPRITVIGNDEVYDLSDFANASTGILFALLVTTVIRYTRRGIISHFQMQKLRALQLETELSLLKAQVNQHFLFNTLNNLYGLSLTAPAQMPEALLQLAGLMRYQLDSSRQNTVTVGTEAEYLANYIGLEKLRLRSNTQVEFTTDLPYPDRPLAPLLLLPLVENCFKHAIGPSGENTIRIQLSQSDVGLTLRTDNSVPPHFRPAPSGLGLPNLRARLDQFYPGNRHQFTVEATEAHYQATLALVL